MARIVIPGAELGDLLAAYEVREGFDQEHENTVVGEGLSLNFTLSQPWLGVGLHDQGNIPVKVEPPLEHGSRNELEQHY